MLKLFSMESLNPRAGNGRSGGLQVIGVGLSRTGTLSFKQAITQLYGANCYHAIDCVGGDGKDLQLWIDAMDGKLTDEDWREYFESRNYVGGCDMPFVMFYKDFLRIYPDAKVVLTTRDFPSWYESIRHFILGLTGTIDCWPVCLFMWAMDGRRQFTPGYVLRVQHYLKVEGCGMTYQEAIEAGPEAAEEFFHAWHAEVERSVPAGRLLLHNAKEGWEPLCKFLNLPVPDTAYPRVNDTASSMRRLRLLQKISGVIYFGVPLACLALACCFLKRN